MFACDAVKPYAITFHFAQLRVRQIKLEKNLYYLITEIKTMILYLSWAQVSLVKEVFD